MTIFGIAHIALENTSDNVIIDVCLSVGTLAKKQLRIFLWFFSLFIAILELHLFYNYWKEPS